MNEKPTDETILEAKTLEAPLFGDGSISTQDDDVICEWKMSNCSELVGMYFTGYM